MNSPLAIPVPPLKSLRTRFALAMGVCGLVFGVIVTVFLEWRLEQATYAAQQRSLKVASEEIAARLADDLATHKREIGLAAELLQQTQLTDPARIQALLDTLKRRQPGYAWIGLTDTSGDILVATDGLQEDQNVAEHPWFRGALKGDYLGGPHEGQRLAKLTSPAQDGEPPRFIDIAIALKDPRGQVQGVLAAHLHWHWIKALVTAMLSDLDGSASLQVLLADRSGTLLLKPDSEPAKSLSELPPMGRPDSMFLGTRTDAGANDLPAGLGWTVVVRQAMQDIRAPIHAARHLMLLLSLGLGIVFIALTWRLAGRIARPISALAGEARAHCTESGQPFLSQVACRPDEVGVLARVIGSLVDGLQVHAGRTALFIEHAPVPLAILDTEMRYVAVSRRWLADYGLEGRHVIGVSYYAVFPEIPEHWREIHRRALAGEVLHAERERFNRANGTTLWLRWEVRPWRTPAGQTGGIVIFSEDITQRVLAEQALHESETRFRATFEQAAVGIAHVGLDGHWLRVNQKLCDIVGYSRDELLNCTFQDITHPDDLDKDLDNLRLMLARDIDTYSMDKRYFRKDGGVIWVQLTVALVWRPDDHPDYFISVVEDISARKEAEATVREQDQMLTDMSAMAHIGGWSFNPATGQGRWTPECARIHDLPDDAPIDVAAGLDYYPDQHRQAIEAAVRAACEDGKSYDLELEILTASGRRKWVRTIGHPVIEQGRVVNVFGTLQDITAHKEAEAAFEANRQRFAGIVASAMDAIISIDARGRVVLFNTAAEAMFRLPADEALGTALERLLPERFRAGHAAHVAQFGSAGKTSRAMGRLGEIWGLRSDGEEFPIEAAISQVEIGGEKLYTVILRDISTRLAAEREIREREAFFRGFFEASSVGSAVLDAQGHYVAVNDCYCAMLDYSRAELLAGMRHFDITHPDDKAEDYERIGRLLRGETDYDFEKRMLKKGGETVWVHVSASAVRNVRGEVEAIVGVAQDITLRRQAAEAMQDYQAQLESKVAERTQELTAARNYFRDFIQRAPLPLCVVDAQAQIVVRNEQFVRMFGYDEAAVPTLAEWWPRAYPDPDYRAWVLATWNAAFAQAQATQQAITPIAYRVTCADGTERYVEISGVILQTGFLATFVDVTTRHQVESELRAQRAQADAANLAKSDFLATMSHEIRTPMNAILGTAQILERANLPQEEHELVGTIRTAGRSLLALINDVLDLSKIEAGHFELDSSPFVLGNVMSNLIDVFTASATNKGLTLSLSPMPGAVDALIGDAYRLGQVLNNLVGNAIKFTTAGQITVSVAVLNDTPKSATLRFSVRDTGIGIPPERLAHLFQAFVQADASTSRHFGGTGLGLAICRQLVTLMGGEIGVDSEPGAGSEFRFVIPFEKSKMGMVATPGTRTRAAGPRLAGRHLLVVDDSAVNLELARRLLALEGASCDTVADGHLALEKLRVRPAEYDLVLMDVQMPGMDGLETTRAIRAELGLTELPIIALTAGTLPSQRERASTAGMNDFLAKPFELDTLVATILLHAIRVAQRPPDAQPSSHAAPLPSEFPPIPGIDGRRAAQRMLGDKALFYFALRFLRDEFGESPEQVRIDVAQNDLKAAARRMHKLRGVAGNVSAETVTTLAGDLERLLDAGNTSPLQPKLAALESALNEILIALPPDLDTPDTEPADDTDLAPGELQQLIDALSRQDMKALRLYAALRAPLIAGHGEAAIQPLTEAIDQLDFETAYEKLHAWYPRP